MFGNVYQNPDGVSVHSGFPNPATDASLQGIDLNKLLIKNSAATFLMRIAGNAWRAMGIFHDDIAIVDRAVVPRKNDLVIWWQDGEFTISHRHQVLPDHPIWGTVTSIIHQYSQKAGQCDA
jgi:hypothetical protein